MKRLVKSTSKYPYTPSIKDINDVLMEDAEFEDDIAGVFNFYDMSYPEDFGTKQWKSYPESMKNQIISLFFKSEGRTQ